MRVEDDVRMTSPMFVCDALYHGYRLIHGTQSPASLTALVEAVVKSGQTNNNQLNTTSLGERCQLKCDDEKFKISGSGRKDEGFESDCESSGSASEEPHSSTNQVKVIEDHVLRLEKLLQEDSSSQGFSSASETSSSTDSDDDSPRATIRTPESSSISTHDHQSGTTSATSTGDVPTPSSEKTSITNQTKVSEFPKCSPQGALKGGSVGTTDPIFVSDILFCHVSLLQPRLVIVVVKIIGSNKVRGHVFECASEVAAKSLYSHYHSASDKYKLDRYRNSKRKVDNNIEGNGETILSKNSIDPHYSTNSLDRKISNSSISSDSSGVSSTNSVIDNTFDSSLNFNITNQIHTENTRFHRNYINRSLKTPGEKTSSYDFQTGNVKIIQIKEPITDGSVSSQRIDEHGVTHIEIESQPNSLASNITATSDYSSIISVSTPDAGDLIQAIGGLPVNLPTRSDHYHVSRSSGNSSSCPNSLITNGREVLIAGEREKKSRQRQPPLLLRREEQVEPPPTDLPKIIDEIPKNSKEWNNRNRKEKHEDVKIVKKENLKPFIESISVTQDQDYATKHDFRKNMVDNSTWGHNSHREINRIRESRDRTRDARDRPRRSHNKGPAPPPPPRRHPSNPSLLLVPTKSGQEPTKSFYPKESHIIRGNKIVRTEYPTFLGWAVGSDGRYTYYSNPHWMGAHEYHAGRGRDSTITPEMRRRSRSKSPARRPMAHKYIDAVATFNFSEKLKDLSDAVFQTKRNIVNTISSSSSSLGISSSSSSSSSQIGSKSHQRTYSTISAPPNCDTESSGLRSLIKKTKKCDSSHDRRVTFSAYATVQVMA